MIRKVMGFFYPIYEARLAERLIDDKQQCLSEFDKCNGKLKHKLLKEIDDLPQDLQKLQTLLEKEFERKSLIENKSSTLFVVVSLLGITFSFLYKATEVFTIPIFLYILLVFFIFGALFYLVLSIYVLLYILVNINIIYEPSSNSVEELKQTVLLNRCQNLKRTNYLSTVYRNILYFFSLMSVAFVVFFFIIVRWYF